MLARIVLALRVAAAALVVTLGTQTLPAQAAHQRPNILFIMADDLGYGDLGCFGQQHIQTPHIDRLARQGTRFTNCYAGGSVCAPSRCVLMTGLHLGHARVRGNAGIVGGVGPQRRVPLERDDVTVAEVLKSAGYATGITGKWGLGEPETTGIPNRQGFDEWFGYLNQQHAHNYYPDYLWSNQTRMELAGNRDGGQQQYSHDLFSEFALAFIRKHREQPFFLYLPWTTPHGKYQIPSVEPYKDKDWPQDYKVHAAMITRMDRDLGRILQLLEELDLADNTLVFFCSDNGAVQRREGVLDSSGPLRGQKGTSYEGGLRTPMIVRWPAHVPAAAVDDRPWYFADVLPTLAEVAGVKSTPAVDGISVLPMLLGKPQDTGDRMLYWEQYSGGYQQAARNGQWKAIRFAGKRTELYDLASDIGETRNVAEEHPSTLKKFEAYFAEAHVDSPHWPVVRRKP